MPLKTVSHQSFLKRSTKARNRIVSRVCETLKQEYGVSRLDNPTDPVDDLVFVILSNKTNPKTSKRIYRKLKDHYKKWSDLPKTRVTKLQRIIREAGLSAKKSRQIRSSLAKIYADFGGDYVRQFSSMSNKELETYLISLSGVSSKVAKCVMLFTLGRKVLPVDVHVHRISRRLGWITNKRADQSHAQLEELVSASRRFAFHVDCVSHGRKICRPRDPLCPDCCVRIHCDFYKARLN